MKDTDGKTITEKDFLNGESTGVELPSKETVIKLKLKKDNTRFGVYYLTTFNNGAVGYGPVYVPGKTGYKCDDGLERWE